VCESVCVILFWASLFSFLVVGRLQNKMYAAGMDQTAYDHILTADDASLLALEFGLNPVVDEDAAFDVYPE
jgi:hypothetical protein